MNVETLIERLFPSPFGAMELYNANDPLTPCGRVKRPPNAFMLFRKVFNKIVREYSDRYKDQTRLSNDAKNIWNAASDEQKRTYQDLYVEIRAIHSAHFPNWRFRPKKYPATWNYLTTRKRQEQQRQKPYSQSEPQPPSQSQPEPQAQLQPQLHPELYQQLQLQYRAYAELEAPFGCAPYVYMHDIAFLSMQQQQQQQSDADEQFIGITVGDSFACDLTGQRPDSLPYPPCNEPKQVPTRFF
jgi:hypothetical protein